MTRRGNEKAPDRADPRAPPPASFGCVGPFGCSRCVYAEWSNGAKPSMHMTRSLGDRDMSALVLGTPETYHLALAPGASARVLIASDGLTDVLDVAVIRAILSSAKYRPAHHAAAGLPNGGGDGGGVDGPAARKTDPDPDAGAAGGAGCCPAESAARALTRSAQRRLAELEVGFLGLCGGQFETAHPSCVRSGRCRN